MSKMLENKSLVIHVAAEIIIVTGISFYFSQKNKKIMGHINDLIQRIEEQEDTIQKHEQLINNLTNALNDINNKITHNSSLNIFKMPYDDNVRNSKKTPSVKVKKNNTLQKENMNNPTKSVDVQLHFIKPNMNNFPSSSITSKVEEIFDKDVEEDENENEDIDENEEESDNLDCEILEELSELELQ